MLTSASACQEEPKKNTPEKPVVAIEFTNQLYNHKFSDIECQSGTSNYDVPGLTAIVAKSGLLTQLESPIIQTTINGATSRHTAATTHSYRIEEIVSNSFPKSIEQKILRPKALRICREYSTPERKTYESAAISTITLLNQAYESYAGTKGSIALRKAVLHIFPHIIFTKKTPGTPDSFSKQYITDNAAFQLKANQPIFYIFPRSIDALSNGFFTEFDLWESPFVIFHEFGHLIFDTHTNYNDGQDRLYSKCFTSSQQTMPILLDAVNEAFADLMSFYLQEDNSLSLAGHTCLEFTRDINKDEFNDGTPKIFTEQVWNSFNSPLPEVGLPCNITNFKDIHHMGALIAHTFHKLTSVNISDKATKANIMMAWVISMRNIVRTHNSSEKELIIKVYQLLLNTIEKYKRVDQNLCQKIEQLVPYLTEQIECPQMLPDRVLYDKN